MIITKLQGGLGNQMFQYAAGKALSLYHNVGLALETSNFSTPEKQHSVQYRNLGIKNFKGVQEIEVDEANSNDIAKYPYLKESQIEKIFPKHKRKVYKEPHFHYDGNFLNGRTNQYIKGYWQSEKYFEKYKEEIASIFQLKEDLVKDVKSRIALEGSAQTVSVHIRRGDYINNPETLNWHGVQNKDYYARAFEELMKLTHIDKVLYFSDDPEWIMNELLPDFPGQIISNTISFNQYEDFYLMQQCSHNIIANSSFSWWAAYLNPNPNKIVIAPKRWFNKAPFNTEDLYPTEWLKV
jgi:hypothetical protein